MRQKSGATVSDVSTSDLCNFQDLRDIASLVYLLCMAPGEFSVPTLHQESVPISKVWWRHLHLAVEQRGPQAAPWELCTGGVIVYFAIWCRGRENGAVGVLVRDGKEKARAIGLRHDINVEIIWTDDSTSSHIQGTPKQTGGCWFIQDSHSGSPSLAHAGTSLVQ
ncbi:hypothetical protein E2C01_004626 [Portunus trituberculatus]|uniref:Uncharacterized protein n=1 Tax=Portunus trituberculatus TaxID=210409 RepID=A0A5B7CR06_PORTR|nr:hypothetical protein [Portunus trituberculatus]